MFGQGRQYSRLPAEHRESPWRNHTASLLAGLLLVALAALLFLYNLNWCPKTWFDEGEFLQVPKNLVLYGKYAMKSSEGFRYFDPSLTTGPTVLFPIAALFKIFGIGLVQARIVVVTYAIALLVLLYRFVRSMDNWRTALVAVGLLVSAPWTAFLVLGRQVMGEVPAFTFVLLGLYLWWNSIDKESRAFSMGSGVAFGLAVLAKPQSALIWPALVLIGLVDRLYYRSLKARHWLFPCLISIGFLGAWYGVQWAVLGTNEFLAQLELTGSATGATLAVVLPRRILANLNGLGRSGYLIWGLPALVYQGLVTVRKKRSGVKEFFVISVVLIWLLWFVFGSVGWERYAFTPMGLTCIFIARLFHDVTDGFHVKKRGLISEVVNGHTGPALGKLALILLPFSLIIYGLLAQINTIATEADRTPQAFADYLNAHVDKSEVIETWEWEIAFLTDHNYHHPAFEVLEAMIRHVQFGAPFDETMYDFRQFHPKHLIDGPFSKWTQLYPKEFLQQQCELVTRVGKYDLYRIGRESGLP